MNEKLNELAEKCGSWDHCDCGNIRFNWEEFAELLIRECATVVNKKIGPKSALDILEHFGVEE